MKQAVYQVILTIPAIFQAVTNFYADNWPKTDAKKPSLVVGEAAVLAAIDLSRFTRQGSLILAGNKLDDNALPIVHNISETLQRYGQVLLVPGNELNTATLGSKKIILGKTMKKLDYVNAFKELENRNLGTLSEVGGSRGAKAMVFMKEYPPPEGHKDCEDFEHLLSELDVTLDQYRRMYGHSSSPSSQPVTPVPSKSSRSKSSSSESKAQVKKASSSKTSQPVPKPKLTTSKVSRSLSFLCVMYFSLSGVISLDSGTIASKCGLFVSLLSLSLSLSFPAAPSLSLSLVFFWMKTVSSHLFVLFSLFSFFFSYVLSCVSLNAWVCTPLLGAVLNWARDQRLRLLRLNHRASSPSHPILDNEVNLSDLCLRRLLLPHQLLHHLHHPLIENRPPSREIAQTVQDRGESRYV